MQIYVALLKPLGGCKGTYSKKRKEARFTCRTMWWTSALISCPASIFPSCADSTLTPSLFSSTLSPFDVDRNNFSLTSGVCGPGLANQTTASFWPERLAQGYVCDPRRSSELNSRDLCGASMRRKIPLPLVVTQQEGSNPGLLCTPTHSPENKATSEAKG